MLMIRRQESPDGPENTSRKASISTTAANCSVNLSLDTNGFVLTQHETAVGDFYDPDEVKSVYYPEVERLIKRVTGAERVVIFDHIVRNPVLAERGEKGARPPAKIVHNDYSFKSAPRRVRDHLPEEADRLLKNRFRRDQRMARDSRPDRKLAAGAVRRPQPGHGGYRAD